MIQFYDFDVKKGWTKSSMQEGTLKSFRQQMESKGYIFNTSIENFVLAADILESREKTDKNFIVLITTRLNSYVVFASELPDLVELCNKINISF